MKTKNLNLIIVGIIIIGSIIRLSSLQLRSIWFDEAFSYFTSSLDIPSLIRATAADNHPPLYYILLHFWMNLGHSELILRLLSTIFGIISIPLIFFLGKQIHSVKTGIWSSILLAFSPLHVFYSQEVRMYTLAIFLNIILLLFFIKILNSENRWSKYGYIITLLLGLYTHYYFIFSWLTTNLIFIFTFSKNKKRLFRWFYAQVLIFLIYLPWIYIFRVNSHPKPWDYELLKIIPATFMSYAMGGLAPNNLKIILLDSPHYHIKFIGIVLSFWMFILFSFGLIKTLLNNNRTKYKSSFSRSFLLSSGFILIPMGFITFITFIYPIYSLNSFSVFSPFYYLAIAVVISQIKPIKTEYATILISTILSISILIFMRLNPIFHGNPIKLVSQHPFIDYKKGDAIAHASIYSYYPFRYYHRDSNHEFLIFESGLSQSTINEIGGNPTPIEELEKIYNRIWFIGITFLSPPQDVQSTVNNLSSRHKLISSSKHNNVEIYQFEIQPPD